MQEKWVFDKESFFDFLGFMIVHAPDFPEEDFLDPDEQLDIEKAFVELNDGIVLIGESVSKSQFNEMKAIVKKSLDCFRDGDEVGGTSAIQELDEIVKQVVKKSHQRDGTMGTGTAGNDRDRSSDASRPAERE